MTHTPKVCNPRAAYYAPSERVPAKRASGRISAECRRRYPPGVPILAFGDRVDADMLRQPGDDGTVRVVAQPTVSIDAVAASALTPQCMADFADLFRETFANAPYGQFAYDRHAGRVLSITEALDTPQRYLSLSQMEAEVHHAGLVPFMDPQRTRALIGERFEDPGIVARAICSVTDRLLGAVHVRQATLERLFDTEDWLRPYQWLAAHEGMPTTDPQTFFSLADFHFGLSRRSAVVTVSAQMVHPDLRGGDVFAKLMRAAAEALPVEWGVLPLLSESRADTPAHVLNTGVHERCVHGMLPTGHALLFCQRLASALWFFEGPPSRIATRIRGTVQQKRKGLVPHADDHPDVEVRRAPNGKGLGVFATRALARGSVVGRFTGEVYRSAAATRVPAVMADHCIQIGPDRYLHAPNSLAEHINHSCAPNCGVRGLSAIVTARDVAAGEELCWDYRLSEDSDWVLEQCRCGATECTSRVAGFSSLPGDRQADYSARGMVSDWILAARAAR